MKNIKEIIKKDFKTYEEKVYLIDNIDILFSLINSSWKKFNDLFLNLFTNEEGLVLLKKYERNMQVGALLLSCSDDIKVKYINQIRIDGLKYLIVKSIYNNDIKKECLKYLNDELIESIINSFPEFERINCLKYIKNEKIKVRIILNIKNEKLRIEGISSIKSLLEKKEIVLTLSDEKKLDFFKSLKIEEKMCFLSIIYSIHCDEYKLKLLNEKLISISDKLRIIKSLSDDYYIFKGLEFIKGNIDVFRFEILLSLKDKENIIKFIKEYNVENHYIERYLEITKNKDLEEIIKLLYDKISNYYCIKYNIEKDKLTVFLDSFGYKYIRNLNNENIRNILTLEKEEIVKLSSLFNIKEVNNSLVEPVFESLIQRLFNIENNEIVQLFTKLKKLIINNNHQELINILNVVFERLGLNCNFEEHLLNDNQEQLIEFVHEIVNSYISLSRELYAKVEKKQIKKYLKLKRVIDKDKLINDFIKNETLENILKRLYLLDYSKLDNDMIDLLKNENILIECIMFKKDPNKLNVEYKYLRIFNKLLKQLFMQSKLDYFVKEIHYKEDFDTDYDLISILSKLNLEEIKNSLLNNESRLNELKQILERFKIMSFGNLFQPLLKQNGFDYNINLVVDIINNSNLILKRLKKYPKVDFLTLINEIVCCSIRSSSTIEMLGDKVYNLIKLNPLPYSSNIPFEDRLKELLYEIKLMFKRDYITIPPIKRTIELNDKKIIVSISNLLDFDNFIYGELTKSCMRIGGAGNSLLKFCAINENGFHITLTDSNNNLLSRVSGFRNGNTVFLNELRDSLSIDYSSKDLIEAIKKYAEELIEASKNSRFPIENVYISSKFAMSGYKGLKSCLLEQNIKKGFNDFYLDIVSNSSILLATSNNNIKLDPSSVERYIYRKQPLFYIGKSAYDSVMRLKYVDSLLTDENINETPIISTTYAVVGEDWAIYLENDEVKQFVLNGISKQRQQLAYKEMENYLKIFIQNIEENIEINDRTYIKKY